MKKGFTLIELLAVIVILAIIALIATPIILNIIKNIQVQAKLRSAENYIDAVEQAIVRENLTEEFVPEKCSVSYGNLICDDGTQLEVKIDGKSPISGTIIFDKGHVDTVIGLRYDNNDYISTDENGKLVLEKISGETDIWDGFTISTGLTGCGTYNNPYLINTAADLIYMRNQVNIGGEITLLDTKCGTNVISSAAKASYRQTKNIAFNVTKNYTSWTSSTTGLNEWIPIGTYDNPFYGDYDGNNLLISGLFVSREQNYNGLFGVIKIDGSTSLNNLKLTKSFINVGGFTGSLVGYVTYETSGSFTVQNCTSDINYKSTIEDYRKADLGGLVGYISSLYDGGVAIVNSSYNGNIDVKTDYVGGLIGYIWGNNKIYFTLANSYNTGSIKGNDYIGGLIGYSQNLAVFYVENSYNKGNIVGKRKIGGIGGYIDERSVSLSNSYNQGNVTGIIAVGGIVGNLTSYSSLNITKAYNKGNIVGAEEVGGIVGYISSTNNFIMSEIYNTGKIFGEVEIGGIVGQIGHSGSSDKITKVYNTGEITISKDTTSTSAISAGGLVGVAGTTNNLNTLIIEKSYNTGKINAKSSQFEGYDVGGIIGSGSSEGTLNIIDCYNMGTINVTNIVRVGGIIGGSSSKTNITNVYNSANINNTTTLKNGSTSSGGIVGANNISSVSNAYNLGNITLNSSYNYNSISGIINDGSASSIINSHNTGVLSNTNSSGINLISGISSQKAAISQNNSYLSSTAPTGIYYDDANTGVTAIDNMANMPNLLNVIGCEFVKDNNSNYPILRWQKNSYGDDYSACKVAAAKSKYSYYLNIKFKNDDTEYLYFSNTMMGIMEHYSDDDSKRVVSIPSYYRPDSTYTTGTLFTKTSTTNWTLVTDSGTINKYYKNLTGTDAKLENINKWFDKFYYNYPLVLYKNDTNGVITNYATLNENPNSSI